MRKASVELTAKPRRNRGLQVLIGIEESYELYQSSLESRARILIVGKTSGSDSDPDLGASRGRIRQHLFWVDLRRPGR